MGPPYCSYHGSRTPSSSHIRNKRMQKTGPPNRVPKEVQHHFHPHGISTPSSPPGIHKMQNAEHPPATSRKHDTTIIPTRNKRMRIAGLSKLLPHGSKTPLSSPPGINGCGSRDSQNCYLMEAKHHYHLHREYHRHLPHKEYGFGTRNIQMLPQGSITPSSSPPGIHGCTNRTTQPTRHLHKTS